MAKKKVAKKKVDKPVINAGDFSKCNDGQSGNRVFVAIGKTINMGNYESIRVEVGQGETVNDGDFETAKQRCVKSAQGTLEELCELAESGKMG